MFDPEFQYLLNKEYQKEMQRNSQQARRFAQPAQSWYSRFAQWLKASAFQREPEKSIAGRRPNVEKSYAKVSC